ncbi:hypothetical protein BaRGS_00035117, partial [Batillaria attramentaria]
FSASLLAIFFRSFINLFFSSAVPEFSRQFHYWRQPSVKTSTVHRQPVSMSSYFVEQYMDEYDVMSMERHKYVHSSHSGKGRSKREAMANTNRHDISGHTRKAVQKLVNNNRKQRLSSSS